MISNFEQIQHHLVAGWVERESNKNIQGNLDIPWQYQETFRFLVFPGYKIAEISL